MNRFWLYLKNAGLPVGLLIALNTTFVGRRTSPLDAVATTILASVSFAAMVALVIEAFIRTTKRTWVSVALVHLLVLATSVVGGMALLEGIDRLPHGRWSRLPDPPESVSGFAGPSCLRLDGQDHGALLVTTRSGHYLAYHPDLQSGSPWIVEPSIPDSIARRGRFCHPMLTARATPFKWGRVVATHRIDEDGVDCAGRHHFLLMADGTLWTWSTGGCAISWFFFRVLFVAWSALVGLIALHVRLASTLRPRWSRAATATS